MSSNKSDLEDQYAIFEDVTSVTERRGSTGSSSQNGQEGSNGQNGTEISPSRYSPRNPVGQEVPASPMVCSKYILRNFFASIMSMISLGKRRGARVHTEVREEPKKLVSWIVSLVFACFLFILDMWNRFLDFIKSIVNPKAYVRLIVRLMARLNQIWRDFDLKKLVKHVIAVVIAILENIWHCFFQIRSPKL